MLYKRIDVELIVLADEAEAVVAELEAALDRLEEKHTLFGGGIATVPFEHLGVQKRSARSRIQRPQLGQRPPLSGLHVRAWLLHSAQSSDEGRPGKNLFPTISSEPHLPCGRRSMFFCEIAASLRTLPGLDLLEMITSAK